MQTHTYDIKEILFKSRIGLLCKFTTSTTPLPQPMTCWPLLSNHFTGNRALLKCGHSYMMIIIIKFLIFFALYNSKNSLNLPLDLYLPLAQLCFLFGSCFVVESNPQKPVSLHQTSGIIIINRKHAMENNPLTAMTIKNESEKKRRKKIVKKVLFLF